MAPPWFALLPLVLRRVPDVSYTVASVSFIVLASAAVVVALQTAGAWLGGAGVTVLVVVFALGRQTSS